MVKIDTQIKGDITAIANGIERNLTSIPSGMEKILCLAFGQKYLTMIRNLCLTKAQTAHDVEKILTGDLRFNNNELFEAIPETVGILPAANQLLEQSSQDEGENILKCVGAAVKHYLENEAPIEINDISNTFFYRWRNEARFFSEPEMQNLWGKILSGEISSPKSFSLKTLDIIRNITVNEANIFSSLADTVVFDKYALVADDKNNPAPSLSVKDLELMNEVGLLTYRYSFGTTGKLLATTRNGKNAFFIDYGDYCLIFYGDEAPSMQFNSLTNSGRELYGIVDKPTPEKASSIAKFLLIQKEFSNFSQVELLKYLKRAKADGDVHQTEHICFVERD